MARTALPCFVFLGLFFGLISSLVAFPSSQYSPTSVRNWIDSLDIQLSRYIRDNSGKDVLTQEYNKYEKYAGFKRVNRADIAKGVAEELQKLLKRKMEFLEKNVAKAEEFAAAHRYNDSLSINDVDYVAAKDVKANDTRFTYSPQFKQKVAQNFSSVHIPVEIYKGDLDILNGLKWSAQLDEIWMNNRKEDPSLLWQYFGSQTGFMRTLPASKWRGEGVDLYDVRRRTWYTQGSSSPKDMLILMDMFANVTTPSAIAIVLSLPSGSVHGQALQLMKVAVQSLLDTLGENDFVNVAYFNKSVEFISCFKTFVQANHRNKMYLNKHIDALRAGDMASYSTALEFAFQQFKNFRQSAVKGQGAQCNEVIMLLTDGGTEQPDDIFRKYNWPKMEVRVFTYAIGPTATPLAAVKWMACSNRGYFSRIPAMGAIRTKVQGLGMMTTVTLPVYDRGSNNSNNQTILGVMGIDVTTKEMEARVPQNRLGPNGYGFSINANGYIVFHPDLKAQKGWLKDPPNVDFLEIEVGNEEKEELRNDMIQAKKGEQLLETFVISKDERYITKKKRYYTHHPIDKTTFSVGIVNPKDNDWYLNVKKSVMNAFDDAALTSDEAGVLIAPWEYCKNISGALLEASGMEAVEILLNTTKKKPGDCNTDILRHLYLDALATKIMEKEWKSKKEKDIDAYFVGTNGGLTRVYPVNSSMDFDAYRDTFKAAYYNRILDDKDLTIFIPPHVNSVPSDPNATAPSIIGVRAATFFQKNYKGAVTGIKFKSERIKQMLLNGNIPGCDNPDKTICYLVDNGAFLVATNQEDKEMKIGMFLGQVDPSLMTYLINETVFDRVVHFDYQASCPKPVEYSSAGPRSYYIPSIPFFELLSINWWTSKVAWAYASFNIYNWIFGDPVYTGVYADEGEELKDNVSCITKGAFYYYTDRANDSYQSSFECDNCTRQFYAARLLNTNLMVLITEPECYECNLSPPIQAAREGPDICTVRPRFRNRPGDCHSWDAAENTSDCGACSNVRGSLLVVLLVVLISMVYLQQT